MFLLKRTAASSTHWLSFWSGMWAGSTLRQSHACVQCQAMPGQLTVCGMLVWDIKIKETRAQTCLWSNCLTMESEPPREYSWKQDKKDFLRIDTREAEGTGLEFKNGSLLVLTRVIWEKNYSFYMQIICLPYSWHDFSLPSPDNPSVFSESTIVLGRVTFSFPFPRLPSDAFWSGIGYGVDFSLYNVP